MTEPYTELNDSEYFGKRLVNLTQIHTGAKVLDIGFGNGASLFPALMRVGTNGVVTGVETDESCVTFMNNEIVNRGIKNAKIYLMNALSMEFPNDTFDYIIGGFMVPFLLNSNKQSIASEVIKVLKKNGIIGLSSWEFIEDLDFMRNILRNFLPIEVSDDDLSLYTVYPMKELKEILKNTGLHDIMSYAERADFIYPDEIQWWEAMLKVTSWKHHIAQITADGTITVEDIKRKAFKKLEKHKKPDGFHFTTAVYLVFGTK